MKPFRDLDPAEFRDATVIVDIDGTLVADGATELAEPEAHTLAGLAKVARVYLSSNGLRGRGPALTERYRISVIDTPYRKPDPRAAGDIDRSAGPIVVVGDKSLTDGRFASRLGARFVQVARLTDGHESLFVRLSYLIDAPWPYIQLARPRQWVKNLLILVPIFFVVEVLDLRLLGPALIAVAAFSAASAAGYAVNDAFDAAEDARHPTKRHRPIAAGRIARRGAFVFGGMLAALALVLASMSDVLPWVVAYLVLSQLYSHSLKHVPILELIVVPCFYLIRILAGGAAVHVPISGWLILTTLFSTLFITAGKRYGEYRSGGSRPVLAHYPAEFIAALPPFAGALTVIAYALYTILGTTHPLFIYSNIFVLFGVLWYLRTVYGGGGEDPEARLWKDPFLIGAIALWGLYLFVILYGAHLGILSA